MDIREYYLKLQLVLNELYLKSNLKPLTILQHE
jgi:hypothetical protein